MSITESLKKLELIKNNFKLVPHPEGGHYIENYRDHSGSASHIYYLLTKGEISHWHKLKKNEIIQYCDGDPLIISISKNNENITKIKLGRNLSKNERYHYVVQSETWFSMQTLNNWSLIACIVAPAFSFKDFELAPKDWLPGKIKT